jgi:hypothetical protein
LKQLLSRLGIPDEYISAHLAMLNHLNRHIEIAGQIGDVVPSTCGIPEGCAASVSCMVALTVLAANVMQRVCPTVQVSMFADNWAVITQAIQTLQNVVQMLERFVHCLGMKLAPSKSWLWGTSCELRKGLRDVTMSGQPVPVKNSAKDLGCDIAYTKQMTKKQALEDLTNPCVFYVGLGKKESQKISLVACAQQSALELLAMALKWLGSPTSNFIACAVRSLLHWAYISQVRTPSLPLEPLV